MDDGDYDDYDWYLDTPYWLIEDDIEDSGGGCSDFSSLGCLAYAFIGLGCGILCALLNRLI